MSPETRSKFVERPLAFALGKPWNDSVRFEMVRFGRVCFLVGPNGSGKSRFARLLKDHLGKEARILGTDRLQGIGRTTGSSLIGDNFQQGYRKDWFTNFRSAGIGEGSGLDTFVILEERPDIRVIIEATLSNLFSRTIKLEWDSGNLVPSVLLEKTGEGYRLDRDECHGIKELLVLLTHLYNDQHKFLVIDEPELHLHPQYQSFFMQEVRKIAGDPDSGGRSKVVFLVTHSPFILDFRSTEDLASVISFSADHEPPSFIKNSGQADKLSALVPRLNVYHKQLFFSDNPIFVEGISDALLIEAIQERRGVSISSAGSCIIQAGGCEEVSKYITLCRQLNKRAFFFYDLDSLFIGNLRRCIQADGSISAFLADLGIGSDFSKYCGELDRNLNEAIGLLRKTETEHVRDQDLCGYISELAGNGDLKGANLARARVAVASDLARDRTRIAGHIGEALAANIEGRLRRIAEILRSRNILLLTRGALEHYLPSYQGNRFAMDESAKRNAVDAEVALLSTGTLDGDLDRRYGELFENICLLPAKKPVDTDAILREYAANFIHELQGLVITNPVWGVDEINRHFTRTGSGLGKLFQIASFNRTCAGSFDALIRIVGSPGRTIHATQDTNAGMRRFAIDDASSQ